uniref:Uncharacterized protein n=1 Tax=Noccaea caerulescens TaxID=107243 RepID=A0A1J3EMQ7_NOCCA
MTKGSSEMDPDRLFILKNLCSCACVSVSEWSHFLKNVFLCTFDFRTFNFLNYTAHETLRMIQDGESKYMSMKLFPQSDKLCFHYDEIKSSNLLHPLCVYFSLCFAETKATS